MYFFSYDRCRNKHRIYAIEVKNEKGELLGYRPMVDRSPKEGGRIEEISDLFPALKWKVFSTEEICIGFAIDFFTNTVPIMHENMKVLRAEK